MKDCVPSPSSSSCAHRAKRDTGEVRRRESWRAAGTGGGTREEEEGLRHVHVSGRRAGKCRARLTTKLPFISPEIICLLLLFICFSCWMACIVLHLQMPLRLALLIWCKFLMNYALGFDSTVEYGAEGHGGRHQESRYVLQQIIYRHLYLSVSTSGWIFISIFTSTSTSISISIPTSMFISIYIYMYICVTISLFRKIWFDHCKPSSFPTPYLQIPCQMSTRRAS